MEGFEQYEGIKTPEEEIIPRAMGSMIPKMGKFYRDRLEKVEEEGGASGKIYNVFKAIDWDSMKARKNQEGEVCLRLEPEALLSKNYEGIIKLIHVPDYNYGGALWNRWMLRGEGVKDTSGKSTLFTKFDLLRIRSEWERRFGEEQKLKDDEHADFFASLLLDKEGEVYQVRGSLDGEIVQPIKGASKQSEEIVRSKVLDLFREFVPLFGEKRNKE